MQQALGLIETRGLVAAIESIIPKGPPEEKPADKKKTPTRKRKPKKTS